MADETKPEVPSAPPTGATRGDTACTAPPAAAPPPRRTSPATPAARRPRPARRADPRSGGEDDQRGLGGRGGRQSAAATPPKPAAAAAGRDAGRHLAAADAARLDGPRLGRVLGGVCRGAGGDRPLHVPQRAQRAAAAVQGRFPERVRHGRRRAVEGKVRHLAGADARRHRAERGRLLRAASSPAPTWGARRTICRRKTSSSARATAAASA